jgi:hypothetical protein
VKVNASLEPINSMKLVKLFKEFKDSFVWTYKDLKGIPPKITIHQIELDTLILLVHITNISRKVPHLQLCLQSHFNYKT